MSGSKDMINVTCKSHMNRSEKDLYKLCPSKLNKRELEDVYFALFESNIQLKKTLNEQQDEIKILTTKVQRLTTQKPVRNYNKDCCVKSMAVINEQKESIADLKRVNERLTDRLRLLNIKLCSTKQYLRRPPQSTRCSKCSLAFNTSIKNSSMSALYTKRSETNLRPTTSCEYLDKENNPMKSVGISTQTENKPEEDCEQNKCRTIINELKQKIVNFEEELTKTREKCSEKLNKLDEEVNLLRIENSHMKAEKIAEEQKQLNLQQKLNDVLEKLREAEEKCDDLTAQLMMEKGKVSELEMLLKAADLSSQVVKTLEKQLENSILLAPKITTTIHEGSSIKINNDDSGYTDTNKSQDNDKKESNLDQSILEQIANLKVELDSLKLSLKNDVLKREVTQNSETLQDRTNIAASLLLTDTVSYSNVLTTADVHPTPSILKTKDAATPKENIDNPNKESIYDTQTDNLNDKRSLHISAIPRLNKNVKNALKVMRSNVFNKKDCNNSEYDVANQLDNDNSNEITNNNNTSSKVDNIDENKLDIKSINTMKDSKENTNNKASVKLAKKESINSDSETLNSESQIINKRQHNKANNNNDSNNKPSNANKISKNDEIKPYHNGNKVESPKAKDLLDRKDKSRRNEKKVKDTELMKVTSKVKRRMSYDIEVTLNNKDKLTKAASDDDIGSKTYSISPKKPLATSSPNNHGTYTIKNIKNTKGFANTRVSSPDNTECEISSLTDLPREIDDRSPFDYISPGEERLTTTFSESFATTTDYGSLSEGEIPTGRRSSYTDEDMRRKIAETRLEMSSTNMQETLKAISDEVSRCKRLLNQPIAFPDITTQFPFNTLTLN